ncbi:unnamed protein product [Sphagnum tenellum]
MKVFKVKLSQNHEVWLGDHTLSCLPEASLFKSASQIFIFTDQRLRSKARDLAHQLRSSLGTNSRVKVIALPVSEDLKSFKQVYPLYGKLLKFGGDRASVLLALGGGVIGDLVGFIAGTYLRGIRWVGIPTTLLAQVDSCLGGKTGVNHELGKNLVGVIHQPSLVVCDLSFLATLKKRDRISGLGEMIKYGLIFDSALFLRLKKNWVKILQGDFSVQDIQACLKWKSSVVEKDERDECGIREVLNFGHTFGHALEAESNYGYFRHGEAILYGMRVACFISLQKGYLSQPVHAEIESFLKSIPVPPLPKAITMERYLRRIRLDKKSLAGRVRFVLLKEVGKTLSDHQVTRAEIKQAIAFVSGECA